MIQSVLPVRINPYCTEDDGLRGHKPSDRYPGQPDPSRNVGELPVDWHFSEELALRMCCEPANQCWLDCVDSAGEHLARHLDDLGDLPEDGMG